MTSQPMILAVDLGTSGLKVALVTIDGHIVGWESQPIQLIITPDGGSEQSPDEWWSAFLTASGRLLDRQSDEARSRVVAVCCSTQGEGTIPVDRNGQPLSNAILWMDMRGAKALRRQLRGLVNIDGASLPKLLRFVRLTGGAPSMTGKDPAGHILWLRDDHPKIYERTYKFLNVLDYLNLRLSGEMVASFDSIVTTWVTDNRDPNSIRYNDGLLSCLGIERSKLPDLAACTSVIGTLRNDVADVLGLARSVKVVAGSIDNTAAAIGSGAVADFQVHLYIGTSSWLGAHVPFKKTDLKSKLASIPCAVPSRYLLMALQATAGGNLTFLRDNLLLCKDELNPEADRSVFFTRLDEIVQRSRAGAGGVIYTPWIWGERAPIEDASVRAGLLNLSLGTTRADVVRAVLEGIALNTRWLLQPVERFMGRQVDSIHMVGGGAQSDVWCQIFADAMNVQIRQVADPIGANARGAAWIAAVGLDELTFDEIPKLVQIRKNYVPNAKNRSIYGQHFGEFVRTYSKLRGIYRRLNRGL